ncbi:MAG: class III signal peptide-containing protein [Methanobacterium sp.]|jgi:Flp pilus assembly pilin Flp
MEILKDESGQGAAEYMLLFGGVIVIAIAALLIYRQYFAGAANRVVGGNDIQNVRKHVR